MKLWVQGEYNLTYFDITDFLNKTEKDIKKISVESPLTKLDIKKLSFHYVLTYIIKHFKNKINKKVFYLNKERYANYDFISKDYLIKQLNKNIFIPTIELDSEDIFVKNNGELKELNCIYSNYYLKNKPTSRKFKKLLHKEEFYHLIEDLKDVNNIKLLFN
jgi:hypothetical protein